MRTGADMDARQAAAMSWAARSIASSESRYVVARDSAAGTPGAAKAGIAASRSAAVTVSAGEGQGPADPAR